MIAFAANSVLNRAALQGDQIGALPFAVIRVLAGAGMLAVLASLRGGASWLRRFTVGGVASLSLYLICFSAAYVVLDAGAGALILFAGVQITMFAGAIWGGEIVPWRRWVGAALAMAGLAWMLLPGAGGVSFLHGALMGAAAVGWGIYSLIGRGAQDPLASTAASFVGAAPLVAVAWLVSSGGSEINATGIWLAILSGAVTSGLGYAMWYAVLSDLGATRAALAQLTVPVIAVLGGVVFLGEVVSLRLVLSCALVIAGVALGLMSRNGNRARPSSEFPRLPR